MTRKAATAMCRWCGTVLVDRICEHCDRACRNASTCTKCRQSSGRAA